MFGVCLWRGKLVEKVVVIGTGERFYKMWAITMHNYNVVAVLDNTIRGNIKGIGIEDISKITGYTYDKVLVLPVNYMFEIKELFDMYSLMVHILLP